VKDIYLLSKKFPDDERFGLTQQIRRAVISIPSNIAEGAGRGTDNDFSHFLDIANGSAFEVETQLVLSLDLNYILQEEFDNINEKLQVIEKMIFNFNNSLKSKNPKSKTLNSQLSNLIFLFTLFLPLTLLSQPSQIVILHTNDTHSHLESYMEPDVGDVGGVVRRNTFIQKTREQYPNTIVVDAGDFSQGTPYFNLFKGFPEIEIMNKLGYDVVALGNHEFDNGPKILAKRLKQANFKVVCANYQFKNKTLSKLVKPYTIIHLDGKKIGFFGLLCNMKGVVILHNHKENIFLDPVATAQKMVDILQNKEHCDLIICLSHLGINAESEGDVTDKEIAENVSGIDFIIGGHTHLLLEKPVIVNHTKIVQAQNNGIYVGKIEITSGE
jgi:5'-nucleotidase